MDASFVARIEAQIAHERERTAPPPGFPPLPDLPLGRYTDPGFFELERAGLWRSTWLFAAHDSELATVGAYRTGDLAGLPIVVVRGDDTRLRAFVNACRHRGAPVVRDECGSCRMLVCQYHSWGYDLEGTLVRVPDERDFVDLDPPTRGLVPLRCERWGGFWFVSADPDAPPLSDWLGSVATELAHVAEAPLRVVRRSSTVHRCNWKVMAEGFLEVYHLRTIHPQTVAALLDHRGSAISLLPQGHSRMITPMHRARPVAPTERIAGFDSALYDITNPAYGIFPNLITPLDSRGFPLLLFWPEAVDRTRLERVWLGPAEGGPGPEVWDQRLAAFEVVMEEDTRNVEPIQASVAAAAHGGVPLSYQERRIWHVHATVDRVIADRLGPRAVPEHLRVPDLLTAWVDR